MTGPQPLDSDVVQLLRSASTATISTRLFERGLRNTALSGPRPLNPANARFVGEAFTLRYIPAREDIDVLKIFEDRRHPQRVAVEKIGPGQVLVIDCRGENRAGSIGELLMARMIRRGAVAVVTDGAVRDSSRCAALSIPVFCKGVAATTNLATHHAADLQVPIGCGGVAVYPFDVLVGDEDGVVCIPRHLASIVAREAAEQEALEGFLRERIAGGASLLGTYPPDEATIRDWESTGGVSKDGSSPSVASSPLDEKRKQSPSPEDGSGKKGRPETGQKR